MIPLVIMLITYSRTDYAIETMRATIKNLRYDGPITWYVCDDGSPKKHYNTVLKYLKQKKQAICGHHSERLGYGAGVNKAWRIASQQSPISLWLEDDWRLHHDLDITPHVTLLEEDKSIGMVRLGYIQEKVKGQTIPHNGHMYLDINLDNYFAFAGHPHLKNDRFMLYYGDYPENHNPGATELKYEENIRFVAKEKGGPRIFWHMPCNWGHWAHFGAIDSYE